jgi:hypothetical protein
MGREGCTRWKDCLSFHFAMLQCLTFVGLSHHRFQGKKTHGISVWNFQMPINVSSSGQWWFPRLRSSADESPAQKNAGDESSPFTVFVYCIAVYG